MKSSTMKMMTSTYLKSLKSRAIDTVNACVTSCVQVDVREKSDNILKGILDYFQHCYGVIEDLLSGIGESTPENVDKVVQEERRYLSKIQTRSLKILQEELPTGSIHVFHLNILTAVLSFFRSKLGVVALFKTLLAKRIASKEVGYPWVTYFTKMMATRVHMLEVEMTSLAVITKAKIR